MMKCSCQGFRLHGRKGNPIVEREARLSAINEKDAGSREPAGRNEETGKRAAKREALLKEAAGLLNDHGAGSVSLQELGAVVGLSRNALYYYVRDRDDLLLQSYERSCRLTETDLEAAGREAAMSDTVAAISTFFKRSLAADRPPTAVLGDVDVLPEAPRAHVRGLEAKNIDLLRKLLRDGVSRGQLRPHDDEIAAQSIMGMISWVIPSISWLARDDSPAQRENLAATFCTVLLDGIATHAPVDYPRIDLDVLTLRPFDPFDRRQSSEIKAQQIVDAACRLISRKGIDGTSLDDITTEVGVSKGVIYHYFRDKMDLVVRCHQRSLDLHEMFQGVAYAAEASAAARIASIIDVTARAKMGKQAPLMLQTGFMNLPDEARSEVAERIAGRRKSMIRNLQRGVKEGSCRDVPADIAGMALTGIIAWLPKWWTPQSRKSADYVASETVALATEGLLPRSETPARETVR